MTFLYFSYGSNLLRQRLQLQNPSAVFVSTGKLKDYTLAFSNLHQKRKTLRWRGGAATIVEAPGQTVWGCIWRLDNIHMDTLDKQEGVYEPIEVEIDQCGNVSSKSISCRSYQLDQFYLQQDEVARRPSPMYMDIIIRGAIQNSLPDEYVQYLRAIETTGVFEETDLYKDILKMVKD